MKQIKLKTDDNVKIAVNAYQSGNSEAVILLPGWCMTKDSKAFVEISKMFAQKYDVLTLDFRGHGKSGGFFTFTAKELYDVDAVVSYAKEFGYNKIYLAGFSLGAALSLIYAAGNKDIDKIIAVSPPSDFDKIENQMWKKSAWGETFKKFEFLRFCSIRASFIQHKKIKPIDIIKAVVCPTIFIAGDKDPTVHPWHTEALYEKAVCPKRLKIYKDGFHAEDLFLHDKEGFSKLCLDWLSL